MSRYIKPKQIITTSALVQQDNETKLSEIAKQVKEIQSVINAEYQEEETKLQDMRDKVSIQLLGLYEKTQNGVNAGSFEHIKAATGVLEVFIKLNGLEKPVNRKPEQKIVTDIKLQFGKPRDN